MEESRPIKRRVSLGGEFSMLSNGKVPPNATDLEEAVLGAIMLEDHCVSLVTAKLIPDHFYRIEHQHIFRAIQELAEKDSPIDILTVTAKCKENGILDMVGGPYFISQLTDRIGSSANVEFHSDIIRQKALAREQIRFFGEGYEMAFDETVDPIDTNDYISMGAERLATSVSFAKRHTNTELVNQVITNAEMARENGGIIGLPTGIHERDRVTKGLQGGKLYIKAARPSMGKSADALCEALHIAIELKLPVAFFSLEMGGMELMQRAISSLSEINLTKITEGDLTKEEWGIINTQARIITDSPLVIIDNIMSLTEIKAESRMLKETKGIKAVFIDYLQLIEHKTSGGGTRENVVSEISRSLKLMAKKLDVPVVALSQLSRSVETRGGEKIPMLSDLRESGAIEQDADLVEFLYRPEYYGVDEFNGKSSYGMAVSIIAKNRGGSLANIEMRFIKHLTKFTRYVEEILPSEPRTVREPDMESYRSPMPISQEFGDIDDLKKEDDEEVF